MIITSTTGDGEPPDTSLKFWRRLKKKTLSKDHLNTLNYALLGNCVISVTVNVNYIACVL